MVVEERKYQGEKMSCLVSVELSFRFAPLHKFLLIFFVRVDPLPAHDAHCRQVRPVQRDGLAEQHGTRDYEHAAHKTQHYHLVVAFVIGHVAGVDGVGVAAAG